MVPPVPGRTPTRNPIMPPRAMAPRALFHSSLVNQSLPVRGIVETSSWNHRSTLKKTSATAKRPTITSRNDIPS
jgi:hypothetical protein